MAEREEVRRYLRQLREMGETSVILDTLTAAEARGLVRAAPADVAPLVEQKSAATQFPGGKGTRLTFDAPVPDNTNDWRAALTAAQEAAPAATALPAAARPTVPPTKPGSGLVVNAQPSDIFTARSGFDTLDDVVAGVATCKRCPLHSAATNPVPGEGNPDADLVCVGEGPGASEDETGRPFVGAAGKLLTAILAAIKLAREDVYICNVVKHRPPGNRPPLPEEITACQPYLVRQIELVRPKAILALGATAAQTLLNTKLALGKLRGSVHRYNGVPLIVTYHPAALLRNPGWKRPTWEDVQLVRRILDSSTSD